MNTEVFLAVFNLLWRDAIVPAPIGYYFEPRQGCG